MARERAMLLAMKHFMRPLLFKNMLSINLPLLSVSSSQTAYSTVASCIEYSCLGRHCITPLYRALRHGSNIVQGLIGLYDAWSNAEKAEKWRAKLPQVDALEE